MPLVSSREMLLQAQQGQYAVGAFNIENMEMAQAVISAAEELCAPVILQTTPSTVRYASPEAFCGIVSALAKCAQVPVALHLDHGSSFELAQAALQAGYTSVMIDGSSEAFEENVAVTRRVVEMAKVFNMPVEAELGMVGGKEDDLVAEGETNTDPTQAEEFVHRTGVDSLAVAIGTAHGFYSGVPVLNKNRLTDIRKAVSVPLVLHGASGLSNEDVQDCIARGICKVNFATELRVAFTDAIKATLQDKPDTYDPKVLGAAGKKRVQALVMDRMRVCGCEGKACAE